MQCDTVSYWSLRKVKMSVTVAEIELTLLLLHQLFHFVHAQSYDLLVECRVAEDRRRVTVFERPAVVQSCWK